MPFARDAGLRFEFTLAARLGMTRAELRTRMSRAEFLAWQIWLKTEVGFANNLAKKDPPQESITFKFLGG